MLQHAFGEPVRAAFTLHRIAVDRPGLAAVFIGDPMRMSRSHEDRMFGCKDQISARNQRLVDHAREAPQILDVVERQGAVDEVESSPRQFQRLEIRDSIFNGGV